MLRQADRTDHEKVPMKGSGSSIFGGSSKFLVIGCALAITALAAGAFLQRRASIARLEQQSAALHLLASQRADQHDAHLTALSAIASAAEGERHDLFLEVAATIERFYPRIDEVQLVPIDPNAVTIGTRPLGTTTAGLVRRVAQNSGGRIELLPHPDRPHHYIMVKRSPNSDAMRYGLMLSIDAEKLLGDPSPLLLQSDVAIRLSLPGGHSLVDREPVGETVRFSRSLSSTSQPLLLETGMKIGLAEMFPPMPTGLTLVAVGLAYVLAWVIVRQRARARAALEQARLNAMDSRLAHASRVNILGEMASGLVHELTQPLTAVLAQVQAVRRLLGRSDTATLVQVLDETVGQAKRASSILERFRDWSRPQRSAAAVCDLREVVGNVGALLAPRAAERGVRLEFHVPDAPVPASADAVEMEQVVFNLIRNAIEATEGADATGRVTLTLLRREDRAELTIADNGPGIAEELRPRLFTPFATTRADGTGLGLSLSQRLVERAGGDIGLIDGPSGATFRVVLPLHAESSEIAR